MVWIFLFNFFLLQLTHDLKFLVATKKSQLQLHLQLVDAEIKIHICQF
jgi:hypothetical protein